MSTIASFYLLDTSKLDELKHNAEVIVKKGFFIKRVEDNYLNYLASNATKLKGFDGSGYICANSLIFLQEKKNIDLLENQYQNIVKELIDKRGNSHFIFTNTQKHVFLAFIKPSLFSLKELQKFNQEFSEEDDEETAKLTLEAIRVLHGNLEKVANENQVLLLIVG